MKERIAIIGGGISGTSAAYFLHKKYDVALLEETTTLAAMEVMRLLNCGIPWKQ